MRTIRLMAIGAVFAAVATANLRAAAAAEADGASLPLGVCDFGLSQLSDTVSGQIKTLQEFGYTGLTMKLDDAKRLQQFDQYREAIKDTGFKIYAGYIPATFTTNNTSLHAHLAQALPRLKSVNAALWLIVRPTELDRRQVAAELRAIADQAQAAGVELVLYPHAGTQILSAEEALTYIREIPSTNIFVSLQMCHEVRASNGERLTEIARKIKPWLRLASLNGTDVEQIPGKDDQARFVQPLGQGDFDASKQLRALSAIGYQGPVILFTYGLKKVSPDHRAQSIQVYREMLGKLPHSN